jgi:poly(3-hydroxybutyrate) depolymerase
MWFATMLLAATLGSTSTVTTIQVDSVNREALVYVPEKVDQPLPVVFCFHGHGGNMRQASRSFRIHEFWPEAIVVYMQGLPTPGRLTDREGRKSGWQHAAGEQGDRDLKFFDALLKELRSKYTLNDKCLYAMGHSNGGGFTYLLWLKRGEVFSGFAPCAAVLREAEQLKPKSALHIAGTKDPLVRFAWQERNMAVIRRTMGVAGEPIDWQKFGKKYSTQDQRSWIEVVHDGAHEYPSFAGELTVVFFKELAATANQVPQTPSTAQAAQNPWNRKGLQAPPKWEQTELAAEQGVKSIFFEGPTYHGKPTRVFAYYGEPTRPQQSREKLPAMVLIHGGGGTAFARWVKVWNDRGYAAIAMDLCGCLPIGTYGNWKRDEQGGPPGWDASFDQLDENPTDQWTYHAISNAILAHSLIRSFPEVDADRIGVTGISWGGYLTSIVAGVDDRFRFASPVYGCGYLGDNSAWLPRFEKLGPAKSKLWLSQWDPANYLPQATIPILWVNGTNDFAYPMDSWQKSYRLAASVPTTLCLRIRMPHGHGPAGENPEEIRVFADALLNRGKPLPKIKSSQLLGDKIVVEYEAEVGIKKAELAYTEQSGAWQQREWKSMDVPIDLVTRTVACQVPAQATVVYINLFDDRDCVVSSPHIEMGNK